MGYVKRVGDPDMWIPKEQLEEGQWYQGKCRNTTAAQYVNGKFMYTRYKFGFSFLDEVECPEDDRGYDVFFAQEKIDDPRNRHGE